MTREPGFAKEWHPTRNGALLPQDVKFSSNKLRWWLCALGHEWDISPNKRRANVKANKGLLGARKMTAGGCPVCAGYRLLTGFNDLATLRPAIAKVWHPTLNGSLTPEDVRIWEMRLVWWLCEAGHAWQANIATKVAHDNGCRRCRRNYRGSRIESAIMAELTKQIPKLAVSEVLPVRWNSKSFASVDAYVPELNLVVEYDGAHWHADRATQDTAKSLAPIRAGCRVLRIRDHPLGSLAIPLPEYAEIFDSGRNPAEIAAMALEAMTLFGTPDNPMDLRQVSTAV